MRQATPEPGFSGRVTVIGEALIDLVPGAAPQSFSALPGGSPYNVAIGLARLGVHTTLMARLSDTAFGRVLRERAQAEGVDLSVAAAASEPTTLAVVSLDEQARAAYDFYTDGTADWQWSDEELAQAPAEADILHFGSLASWMSPGAERIRRRVGELRAGGSALVSYDPNVRPLLLRDPRRSAKLIESCVATSDLIKASAEDVDWLYAGVPADQVAREWLELGAKLVVLTDGPGGARAHTALGVTVVRPGLPIDVTDTVGAGDSFTSGLLASLLRRGVRSGSQLREIGGVELAGAVDDAILTSALTCMRAGAEPPTLAEVERGLSGLSGLSGSPPMP